MITAVVVGFVFIFVLAGVIGVVEQLQAATWRQVAMQRRRSWETRRA